MRHEEIAEVVSELRPERIGQGILAAGSGGHEAGFVTELPTATAV